MTGSRSDDLFVFDWIAEHASRTPDKIATVDAHSGRRHSYATMHARVAGIAGHMRGLGIGKGDRVGLLAMNSSDFLDIVFACWRLGAICTTLNFRLTAHELAFMVNDSGCAMLFHDADLGGVVAALKDMTDVPHWIEIDPTGAGGELDAAIAAAEPVWSQLPQTEADLCMIMYSSGTTGTPKGVTLNHGQFYYVSLGAASSTGASSDMASLVMLPLFHIGGLVGYTLIALAYGGTAVIVRAFEPGSLLANFSDPDLGITHFLGVPAVFNAMRAHPGFDTADFSGMKMMACGAESVPESLLRSWYDRGIVIREGYGMTETCAACLMLDERDVPGMIGSAGKPVRHCVAMIARADGSEADVDELGEIWMRGKNITPGYWNRPDANETSFVNGWFRSGDIGRRDAQGYFTIEDRVKDMYISGGENVYPAEVENVLYELPAIREVAVIGLPHPKWGEMGCAVVAVKEGQTLSLDDIAAQCGDRLAKFKHPGRLEIVDALPRNATGKVLKFELRAQFS
jgi:fatty-acyl-CoA synthase